MPGAAPPRTQRCLSYQGTHQARPDACACTRRRPGRRLSLHRGCADGLRICLALLAAPSDCAPACSHTVAGVHTTD